MATPGVYLIMSESLFEKSGGSGPKGLGKDVDEVMDFMSGDEDHFHKSRLPSGSYGTGSAVLSGAIEVLEFNFDIKQVGSEDGGRPRSIEDIQRSEFRFKKAVDIRSPKLFKYCCEGEYIGQAELQIFGPTTIPYLTYRMTFVHVSSYEPSGGGDLPTEWIGLKYGQMSVKWNDAGIGAAMHGNEKLGHVTQKFSWVMQAPVEFPAGVTGKLEGTAF